MLTCSIVGCGEIVSNDSKDLPGWRVIRACRCGAFDQRNAQTCKCNPMIDPDCPLKITYWPHLDFWAFGGVEEIVLCPEHRREVFREIVLQRLQDPSMNPGGGQNPGNRH